MAVILKSADTSRLRDPRRARRQGQPRTNWGQTVTASLKTAAGTVVMVVVLLWAFWLFAPAFLLRVAR
jgi:hypothetical protein